MVRLASRGVSRMAVEVGWGSSVEVVFEIGVARVRVERSERMKMALLGCMTVENVFVLICMVEFWWARGC